MFFSFSFSYSILQIFYNVIAAIVSGKTSMTLCCLSLLVHLGPHLPVQHLEKCPYLESQIEKWFTPSVFLLLSIKVLSCLLFNAWTHAKNNLPNVIVLQRASLVVQMVENPPAMQGFPGSSAGKESACNAGDLSLMPGLGRSPGEGTGYPLQHSQASCGLYGKESICNVGDLGLIRGLGRSPGKGNSYPLQYSCLENSMDKGSWWAIAHGVTKSKTRLSDTLTHSTS